MKMQKVSVTVETPISPTFRVKSLESVFDCPIGKKQGQTFDVEVPLITEDWSVGLIVGPSGSGKSTVANHVWGKPSTWKWPKDAALIDALAPKKQMTEVSAALGAVGLNTIPSWVRPYHTLSNGEQFRATIARHFLEDESDPIVIDEFTSFVDRQVAQITSNAVQKFIRANGKRFVAVTCHYDIVEWLQPDWVLDMATRTVVVRERRRRPEVGITVASVPISLWETFAPYHYMSAKLHKAARCFAAFVHDRPVAFAAILPRPVSNGKHRGTAIKGLSRLVTLPDYQGLGIAFALTDALGAMYAHQGHRMNTYPAHPSLIASFSRSPKWKRVKEAGTFQAQSKNAQLKGLGARRPNAVFQYIGPKLPIHL